MSPICMAIYFLWSDKDDGNKCIWIWTLLLYWISIVRLIIEYIFLVNLFENIDVNTIFYKFSQNFTPFKSRVVAFFLVYGGSTILASWSTTQKLNEKLKLYTFISIIHIWHSFSSILRVTKF